METGSSQKFIACNRASRAHTVYDIELYDSKKKVQLSFVMGLLSQLSGEPVELFADIADRRFIDLDVDHFDSFQKSQKPRRAFQVANSLTGQGNVTLDIAFESMEDFTPAAIARKVDALNKLLEVQTHLANLLTYMDGKTGAEKLIQKVLQDAGLLKSLRDSSKPVP